MTKYKKQATTATLTAGAGASQLLAITDVNLPAEPSSAIWALPGVAAFKLTNTSAVLPASVTIKSQYKEDDGSWTDDETLVVPLGLASGVTGEQRATLVLTAECNPANYFSARLIASCTGANVDVAASWLSQEPSIPMS